MTRILSGIQPSGTLHLGNYFGAIQQHIALQDEGQALYFIANYHALTSLKDGGKLKEFTYQVAAAYIALGLDINKATLFKQSDIVEIPELAWILSNVVNVSVLQRAHAYKDKVEKGLPASVGLFSYPILMAADILIFQSEVIPVGRDQKQHIEMAADIATSFNHLYQKPVFKIPKYQIQEAGAKVPGLDGEKMSKSYGNTIPIFESASKIRKLVSQIKTDDKKYQSEPLTVEGETVFQLYSLLATPDEIANLADRYLNDRTFGYGHAKQLLAAKLEEKFGPAYQIYQDLLKNPRELDVILAQGQAKAKKISQETIEKVREVVGLK